MTLRLGFIGIVTRDMAASLAFYRTLGVAIDDGQDGAPHVDGSLPDGTALAFDTIEVIRGFDPSFVPASGGHRIALAFARDTPADVDAAAGALVAAGYPAHVAPFDAPWGQRYATFLDPDGNAIDFFAPSETT